MTRPAIFFDRDNTLIVSDGYLGDPAGVQLVPGAAEAIARARAMGFATVVFSNQSGVARGMFDETAVHAVNARLDDLLAEADPAAVIDRHEFCPFHPDASVDEYRHDSDLRKPKPGMIHRAAERLALDLSRSWVVGDAPRDIEAGKAAGCRTILFKDPALVPSPAAAAAMKSNPDYVVTTLAEAVSFIEQALAGNGSIRPAPLTDEVPPPVEPETTDEPEPETATADRAPLPTLADDAQPGDVPPTQAAILLPSPAAMAPNPAESATEPVSPRGAQPRFFATDPTRPPATPPVANTAKLEHLAEQILTELRHAREHAPTDFSISKLFAGITQVVAVALLFLTYIRRDDPNALLTTLLFALTVQTMTIALLIMGRQR